MKLIAFQVYCGITESWTLENYLSLCAEWEFMFWSVSLHLLLGKHLSRAVPFVSPSTVLDLLHFSSNDIVQPHLHKVGIVSEPSGQFRAARIFDVLPLLRCHGPNDLIGVSSFSFTRSRPTFVCPCVRARVFAWCNAPDTFLCKIFNFSKNIMMLFRQSRENKD